MPKSHKPNLLKMIIVIFGVLSTPLIQADVFIYNGLNASFKVRTLATSDYKKSRSRRKLSAALRECKDQTCQFKSIIKGNIFRIKTKLTFHKQDMGIIKIIIDNNEAEKIRKKIIKNAVLMGVAWTGAAVAAGAITAATFGAGAIAVIPIVAGTATTVTPFALEINSLRKDLRGLTMKTAYTKNDIFFLMPRNETPSERVQMVIKGPKRELLLVDSKDWGTLYVQKRTVDAKLPKNALTDQDRLNLLAKFSIGDSVETAGGLCGEITNIYDDRLEIRSGRSQFVVRRNKLNVIDATEDPKVRVVTPSKSPQKVYPSE